MANLQKHTDIAKEPNEEEEAKKPQEQSNSPSM